MSTNNLAKPTIFISYSHKDEEWKDRFMTHIGVAQHQNLLYAWEDRSLGTGEDWDREILDAMNAAAIAILLVSANSLTSEYILHKEVNHLLQRREKEGLRIFPIIIKPCDWEAVSWLRKMNLRPRDGRPISAGTQNQIDADFASVAKEVRELLDRKVTETSPSGLVPLDPEKISTSRLPVTGREFFGRARELQLLDDAWADPDTNVLSLVAWGGVGKSALTNHWLRNMARDHYRGADLVFAWSFFSQGTTDRAVSADLFTDAALRWFGDSDSTNGSAWEKGERLANLIRARRVLLILDGLEPLQYPPGPQEGQLREQALQALLRELAASNPGLCVVSTRLAIAELEEFEGRNTRRIDLDHLSPEAGAQLLKAQGVVGDKADLEQAAVEFGGHSLALTLLGSYLSDVYGGNIRRRDQVGSLEEDERLGGHAQRVMASYEKWLGEGPELEVLRVLGLFNRPADAASIAALRASPPIVGLTDALQQLGEPGWQRVLSKLRRAKLLAAQNPTEPGTLDTHPLVREHFGLQVRRNRAPAWREGNNRLYEHLKRTTKEFPDTIAEMAPLYAAVVHGCEAGKYQEALFEVYTRRIERGDTAFSTEKLGMYETELATLTRFFDVPWTKPVAELNEDSKISVMHVAGYDLMALGRLLEAVEPMRAAMDARKGLGIWDYGATSALNLSEIYLNTGYLDRALSYGRTCVELADRSKQNSIRIRCRTMLGDVLHFVGDLSEAEAVFREAEEMQRTINPKFPLLSSYGGFFYCSLLLTLGKFQDVQTRAATTLEWAKLKAILDVAMDNLSLGRAYSLQAQREHTKNVAEAATFLELAVKGLKHAGVSLYLPMSLLARAELQRTTGQFDQARDDLKEALSIATRNGMTLDQADCHLEYARLYLAMGEKKNDAAIKPEHREKAQGHWTTAKEMIERMGYHRRDKDVKEIEAQLGP